MTLIISYLFTKQTNPNQSNWRSTVQWYFPFEYSPVTPLYWSALALTRTDQTFLQKLDTSNLAYFAAASVVNGKSIFIALRPESRDRNSRKAPPRSIKQNIRWRRGKFGALGLLPYRFLHEDRGLIPFSAKCYLLIMWPNQLETVFVTSFCVWLMKYFKQGREVSKLNTWHWQVSIS
jgi:hypothetical protein